MPDSPIRIYDWIKGDFTADARAGFLDTVGPLLEGLCGPASRVLDLCCGGGAVSFFLETRGASVTGLDLSSQMIESATAEARRRGSSCRFLVADILAYDLGVRQYDLAVLFGNSIQDLPHRDFPDLRDALWAALEEEGRLALDFFDGISELALARDTPEETTHQRTVAIHRRFKSYDPALCAYRQEYRNIATGERCEYTSYIYSGPVIDALMVPRFAVESRVECADGRFLTVYRKGT